MTKLRVLNLPSKRCHLQPGSPITVHHSHVLLQIIITTLTTPTGTVPTSPCVPPVTVLPTPHHEQFRPTGSGSDAAAAPRPDHIRATRGCSHTSVPQNIHVNWTSAPRHLSTADASLPNFDTKNDMLVMHALTTSMEGFTNQIALLDYTYAVSMRWLD